MPEINVWATTPIEVLPQLLSEPVALQVTCPVRVSISLSWRLTAGSPSMPVL